jgi:hypothetical protein
VLGLTFVFDLALNNLLLEGCARTEQHDVLSMLFWDFDSNLHIALLSVCHNYNTKRETRQPVGSLGAVVGTIDLFVWIVYIAILYAKVFKYL